MRGKTFLLAAALLAPISLTAASSQILGWNNLGMHCMDSDYSVFSILPPYNTIEAQLIVGGLLVTNGAGYTVTYQAVADPSGSINTTAIGKGNYYTFAKALYGASLAPDAGLAGWNMPGVSNTPQTMLFETTNAPAAGVTTPVNWWRAEGIPLSPYDDAHNKNPYPLMRLIARNSSGVAIATNDIVLPVSDEMDCRACHASGSADAAKPAAGWVWSGIQERDFRLNILRLHDEHQFARHPDLYAAALAARGFNPQGLYRGVVADNKPVLCASCHASEALGAPSYGTIPQLTTSVHSFHAHVTDPVMNTSLDNADNRQACYLCHPGSTTKCLRGAMGGAIAADGSMEMQCQSCHGNMSAVGSTNRVGWFMEPNCQNCHSGTATVNSGQIRYTSAFDSTGKPRVPADTTFATTTNNPAPGLSLYRFSYGHGGLQCSACHGSTHAEFPSIHPNDNLRNQAIQGHAGVTVECTTCHTATPDTGNGGPHGMHAIGQGWITGSGGVTKHADMIQSLGGAAACTPCHGTDYRGTVLSRAQASRTFQVSLDAGSFTLNLNKGDIVGCYNCHQGSGSSDLNASVPPTVNSVSLSAVNGQSASASVTVSPAAATLRILSQPAHGSVGVSNRVVTYFADPGYVGADSFTYSAYDGMKNSTLGTATVAVSQGAYSITAAAHVPPRYPAGWPVAFAVVPTLVNTALPVTYHWTFGDGTTDTNQFPVHAYTAPGFYAWTVASTVGSATVVNTGTITVTAPVALSPVIASGQTTFSWPVTAADTIIETSASLGADAVWTPVTNGISTGPDVESVTVPTTGMGFLRLRRPW